MENIKASVVAWPTEEERWWVCQWSLSAWLLQFNRAAIENTLVLPDLKLKLLTPAQAANALALYNATLWFSAAVVAMLLDGRARTHRALAGVALASAVAIHCVLTWLIGVTLVTGPSEGLLVASVMVAVRRPDPAPLSTWRGGGGVEPVRRPAGEAEKEP